MPITIQIEDLLKIIKTLEINAIKLIDIADCKIKS
jgi:hypothetical protein